PRAQINRAGGDENALRPQRNLAVSGRARETDAFLDKPPADAVPARFGLDKKNAQLRDLIALAHKHYRARTLAVEFGDPAALTPHIVPFDERGDDLRHQRLETFVPAVFLGVERAVAAHNPAEIAGAGAAERNRRFVLARACEQRLDRICRLNEPPLIVFRERAEHRFDLLPRAPVERCERRLSFLRERKQALPAVGGQGRARNQACAREAIEDAAEIAGVQAERAADRLRRRPIATGKLVEHARLSKRAPALQ